jgi:RNA-directed DNA polymerase
MGSAIACRLAESTRKKRNGKFAVLRQTVRKRLRAKLKAVKLELRRRMHDPVPKVGAWLGSVVKGHTQYYGVPRNGSAVNLFRFEVIRLWMRSLRRRSQKTRLTWERMGRLVRRWIPTARTVHPYPEQRLCVMT